MTNTETEGRKKRKAVSWFTSTALSELITNIKPYTRGCGQNLRSIHTLLSLGDRTVRIPYLSDGKGAWGARRYSAPLCSVTGAGFSAGVSVVFAWDTTNSYYRQRLISTPFLVFSSTASIMQVVKQSRKMHLQKIFNFSVFLVIEYYTADSVKRTPEVDTEWEKSFLIKIESVFANSCLKLSGSNSSGNGSRAFKSISRATYRVKVYGSRKTQLFALQK